MLCFLLCQCPNFNCSVWLEYSVTSQRLCRKYEPCTKYRSDVNVKIFYCYFSFWTVIFLFVYFLLILFFARISLNKYVYLTLWSAISFMDIYAYKFALVKNWSFWLRLFHQVKFLFLKCVVIFLLHLYTNYPSTICFYLFLHWFISINWGHLEKKKSNSYFLFVLTIMIRPWMVMSSYTEINPNPSNRSGRELRVAISGSVGYKINLSV